MFSIFISRCGLSPVLMLYLILTLPQEVEEVQQRMKKCRRQWSGKGHLAQSGIPLLWQVCSQCCATETSSLLYLILNAFFSKQYLLNHILSSTDYCFFLPVEVWWMPVEINLLHISFPQKRQSGNEKETKKVKQNTWRRKSEYFYIKYPLTLYRTTLTLLTL